ncbi:hypothetical protein A2U01_0079597, partial [Trifolium medium]|nr:hypothetical protein [Trifolium medium]
MVEDAMIIPVMAEEPFPPTVLMIDVGAVDPMLALALALLVD